MKLVNKANVTTGKDDNKNNNKSNSNHNSSATWNKVYYSHARSRLFWKLGY